MADEQVGTRMPLQLSKMLYVLNELATAFNYSLNLTIEAGSDEDSVTLVAHGSVYSVTHVPALCVFEIESFCPDCDDHPETIVELADDEIHQTAASLLGFLVGEAIDNAAMALEQDGQ